MFVYFLFYFYLFFLQIGIIGGTGFDNPDILVDKKEEFVDTPYGKVNSSQHYANH